MDFRVVATTGPAASRLSATSAAHADADKPPVNVNTNSKASQTRPESEGGEDKPRRRHLGSHVMTTWMAIGLLFLSFPGILHLQNQVAFVDNAEELHGVFTAESKSPLLSNHSGRKPVIWLHIHKAGGTFMCKQALLENEQLIQPNKHCNYRNKRVDGIPVLGKDELGFNCEKRAALYRRQGATWGQIERHFRLEDLRCGNRFMYGTMLRHPLGLIESTLNYNMFKVQKVVRWLRQRPNTTVCAEACDHAGHDSLSWQIFDNFAVRSFNGLEGWSTLPSMVTEKQYEIAKAWLSKMDVVTILEDLEADVVQLQSAFGWKAVNVSSKENQRDHFVELHGPPLKFFKQLNYYDLRLYEFAKQLAQNKSASALNHTATLH